MSNIKSVRPYGYYDRALQQHFGTEREKKEYLRANGLREDGSMESERRREDRLAEIINEERKKQGLKSKTLQELVGDARKVRGKTIYSFGK